MTFYMSLQGSRAVLNKFSYGKASLRGPTPYPFMYQCSPKRSPSVYLLLTNGTPFTYLVLNSASFLTAVNALSIK